MTSLPTTITTKEGSALRVSISPYDWEEDERPVIEFWHVSPYDWEGGTLCSSYFIETFMAIPDNQGLCLVGHRYEYQSISSDQVTICKKLIRSHERLND